MKHFHQIVSGAKLAVFTPTGSYLIIFKNIGRRDTFIKYDWLDFLAY